jgi:hypothetical protein
MSEDIYKNFISSDDTLRIYRDRALVFSSKKERLLPLMEYIAAGEASQGPVVVYDKVMGNAAALLAVKASASEVYSPLGSEIAVKTLDRYGIKYHLGGTVPYIVRDDGQGMCPMERLSTGKEPEEFYRIMKKRIQQTSPPVSPSP